MIDTTLDEQRKLGQAPKAATPTPAPTAASPSDVNGLTYGGKANPDSPNGTLRDNNGNPIGQVTGGSLYYDPKYTPQSQQPTQDQATADIATKNQLPTSPVSPTPSGTTPPQGVLPYEQAKNNLASGGLQGSQLQTAQDDLKKYYQNFVDGNAGKEAPVSGGSARSVLDQYSKTQQGTYAPAPEIQTQVDDALSVYTKAVADYVNPSNQRTSLVDEYKSMSKELGIPGLQAELLDTNRILNGTEDDIRSEVTAAGGFATESQVQAMTISRNKTLLKKAQFLQDQLTGAKDQLNTMVNLTSQDRQYAEQRAQSNLSLLGNMVQIQQTMKKASIDNYNNIISQVGYDGLAQMTAGDPYNTALIEKTMGLAPGGLAQLGKVSGAERSLDQQYKKAQIDNIYSQINDRNTTGSFGGLGDPSQIVAYAQQYAATGQIPTGLPKGTFGIVAQYAKELPKDKGTLVSKTTGIAPSTATISADRKDALLSLYNAVEKADDLKTSFNKIIPGVIGGTLGKIFGSKDQNDYMTGRDLALKELQYALSGKAITQQEYDYFSGLLPGRFNNAFGFGVNGDVKIDSFKKNISDTLNNKLNGYGASIYGYSKVKIDGNEYTVGDTITDGNRVGRINPDGTITIVE